MRLSTAFLLLATTTCHHDVVMGDKDSTFYPNGMENPLLNEKMYWENADGVLADIDQFDTLYVTHHGCAWSEYDDGSGNPCGHDGAQDDNSWYMSYSPCYRANAAYSLFGILKGEEDTGCNRKTFINSFFTTAGVESFTQAMGYTGEVFTSGSNDDDYYAGGVSASTCEAAEVDEGDDANNNNWMNGWRLNQGYKSFGIGCSNGEYAKMSFLGAHCTKSAIAKVTQELDTFNSEMANIQCQAIYQDGAAVAVQQNDSNGDDDNADNNDNNGDDDGSVMDLLSYSESCNVLEYPKACPDPFGKLVKYNRQLEDSTGFVHNKRKERLRKILSWFMFIVGALMIVSAIIAWREERKEQRAKNQQQQQANKNNRRAERQAERQREQQEYESQQQKNGNQRSRSWSRERSRASNSNSSSNNRKGNRFTRWFRRNKN